MSLIGLIPCRMASTRLPGKPLADINGRPLFLHVYKRAVQACDECYVVTPDDAIREAAEAHGVPCFQTSPHVATGTDCVAEAVVDRLMPAMDEVLVNIQGDEPLISPAAIRLVGELVGSNYVDVANATEIIGHPAQVLNQNVVKAIIHDQRILWLSRWPIPFPKGGQPVYNRQLGLYAFRRDALQWFLLQPQRELERTEGIEMLRFLMGGWKIGASPGESGPAVDTIDDLEKVRGLIRDGV